MLKCRPNLVGSDEKRRAAAAGVAATAQLDVPKVRPVGLAEGVDRRELVQRLAASRRHVKPIRVHDFGPGPHEVGDELLAGVGRGIDLGQCA
jgi:hypothetical protein